MALDDIARGALHLIKWGTDVVPNKKSLEELGPMAARVLSVLDYGKHISPAGASIADDAAYALNALEGRGTPVLDAVNIARDADRIKAFDLGWPKAVGMVGEDSAVVDSLATAASAETLSDLLSPALYKRLTSPLAAGRRFDRTVRDAPEEFTNVARTLGERAMITGPKDIELARRISMLPPNIQDVYFNLLQEGSDPMELLAAMKVLGG